MAGQKKGLGSTVLGWFVVRDGDAADHGEPDADALIKKYADAAPPPPPPPEVKLGDDAPAPSGGQVDFPGVLRAAGISDEQQGRVDKAVGLLKTLPAETPREVKRQIVEASLKAFGFPVDQIIEAGAMEIQALELYIQRGQRDTQKLIADAQKRTDELNAEIGRVKKLVEEQVASQYALTQTCNQQKLTVQEVLEFFGQEAVARVVRDSPRLHEPNPDARPPAK